MPTVLYTKVSPHLPTNLCGSIEESAQHPSPRHPTYEFGTFQWLLGWSTYWEKVAKKYKSTGICQNRSLSSYELDWFKPTITFHVDIFNSSEHSRSTAKPTSRTVCLLKLVAWHAGLRHPKHPKETVGSCWNTHTHPHPIYSFETESKSYSLDKKERVSKFQFCVLSQYSVSVYIPYLLDLWHFVHSG